MGIFLIEIMVPTKLVLSARQPFMPPGGDSIGAIAAFLTNNRVTNGCPIRLKDSLLHPGYYRMYVTTISNRSTMRMTCTK